ncbi:uncharacterized protein LOC130725591 [Lotus japonicus]|uniref:uncharacterized protein LOC130725591 n=1 Tax=Lotus japonicus TaxID=34305 RepID=UPI002582EEB8|nr:uncharacterized protein LOC130725591 [Lotus japonicus]
MKVFDLFIMCCLKEENRCVSEAMSGLVCIVVKQALPTSKGQAPADEYGSKFFETSAKTNVNVEEVFFSIARNIKQRLADTDSRAEIILMNWLRIRMMERIHSSYPILMLSEELKEKNLQKSFVP